MSKKIQKTLKKGEKTVDKGKRLVVLYTSCRGGKPKRHGL